MDDLAVSKLKVQNKIYSTDKKIERLASILEKKLQSKDAEPEENVATRDGFRVSDYRLPPSRQNKSLTLTLTKSQQMTQLNSLELSYQKPPHDRDLQLICKKKLKSVETDEATMIAKKKQAEQRKHVAPPIPHSHLPNRYVRGELPCTIEHGISGNFLSWACPMENLEFEYYLPIFFDGLQCKDYPVSFIARQGVEDMLFWAREHPEKIKNCMKELIRPLRNALSIHDAEVILGTLKAIQFIIRAHCAPEMVPYCKQFLTPVSKYLDDEVNIGDRIDFAQRNNKCVGEQVRITLELLEDNGGPKAYKAIKASIPTCKLM